MGVGQEFYCAESGGGCGGFMSFPLNMNLNGVVEVVCPNCKHKHQRMIKDGLLTDVERHTSTPTETIEPNPACWHKKSEHPESQNRVGDWDLERKAVVLDEPDENSREKGIRPYLSELWFERFGGRK